MGNGRSLKDIQGMPIPEGNYTSHLGNTLIADKLNYNRVELAEEAQELLSTMTDEQKNIFDTIMKSVISNEPSVFFVHGYGGTGKTYLWRSLTSTLRSQGKIVLVVASSGIASMLLPGGRTAHSRFAIPLAINEDSTCSIV